jgi:hypothetical protein
VRTGICYARKVANAPAAVFDLTDAYENIAQLVKRRHVHSIGQLGTRRGSTGAATIHIIPEKQ